MICNPPILWQCNTAPNFVITRHGEKRARRRAGWARPSLERMAQRALERGNLGPSEITRSRWVLKSISGGDPGILPLVYGQFVFVFRADSIRECFCLVTMYQCRASTRHKLATKKVKSHALALAD